MVRTQNEKQHGVSYLLGKINLQNFSTKYLNAEIASIMEGKYIMIIKEISFRRIFNLGNYETMGIELKASINENENIIDVLNQLEKTCNDYRRNK